MTDKSDMPDAFLARPLVSIIIPCYNHGQYLTESCDSALKQTYPNIEVIVINDGSTEMEPILACERQYGNRVTFIHTANGGAPAARNTAIRASAGKYLLPLDADDKIAPTYVEKAVALLENDPQLGIVYCQAEFFGHIAGTWELPAYTLTGILQYNMIFNAAVFRKEDWISCGGYPEDMPYGLEDYDLWMSIVLTGRSVHRIEETLFFYRRHNAISRTDTMEADRSKKLYSLCKVAEHHRDIYTLHPRLLAPLLLEQPLTPQKSRIYSLVRAIAVLIPVRTWRKAFRNKYLYRSYTAHLPR